ncbi:40S ribosomal protein [Phytophthora fragariae]|uniref:40S ribosomal protein S4 n=2 Tax=Phytophthora TaxID=4783 RepID=A0A6A3QKQ3_9STRA|nr:40S ribosomal protein [Phytophthora fragariae]KAE8984513.1 40S ribosomal protein [Phytophthora rubi]KAE8937259.1 40S ribosomal protein [Phytophthora fragariae]KAE8980076.1 40S ribosomal protein [Phytophthora fragariae]KAE9078283.1 40S ribosomal protein [Phytophthora fragariae]
MPRGPRKHLKRMSAPKHWMLGKLDGIWAPRPSSGPHKLRECLPLIIILRNRLKYALTKQEVTMICMQKSVKVDGKVRVDPDFPAGFMDVVELPKTGDQFRLMYDTKGRFVLHRISDEEKKFKLAKVIRQEYTKKAIPYIATNDGRTIRYPDPVIKVGDTVKIDLETGKVVDHIKFEVGNLVTITRGRNSGRVGILHHIERHQGSFNIAHVKDSAGNDFATRLGNVFAVGKEARPWVSLPRGKGVKLNILEERELKEKKANN